jgi:RNase P protein component
MNPNLTKRQTKEIKSLLQPAKVQGHSVVAAVRSSGDDARNEL